MDMTLSAYSRMLNSNRWAMAFTTVTNWSVLKKERTVSDKIEIGDRVSVPDSEYYKIGVVDNILPDGRVVVEWCRWGNVTWQQQKGGQARDVFLQPYELDVHYPDTLQKLYLTPHGYTTKGEV
jgi:hypothetical protein